MVNPVAQRQRATTTPRQGAPPAAGAIPHRSQEALTAPEAARSPLAQYMRRYQDDFTIMLQLLEPDWAETAAFCAAAGLTDHRGRPPDAASAEATWRAVAAEAPQQRRPPGR